MNDIGIDRNLDWQRIKHLYKIGIIAALMVLAGDMILGWGVTDASLSGFDAYFSRYLTVSDFRIITSAILGLIGIPIECLSFFSIYRLIVPYSEQRAHALRTGILGSLTFGSFVHVSCCALVYFGKIIYTYEQVNASERIMRFALAFLMPETVLFLVFYLIMAINQIKAFKNSETPYPANCWIFSVLSGFVVIIIMKLAGNHPLAYALSTGWISIGVLWMYGGLLMKCPK